MITRSTDAAERMGRVLSALRLDVLIFIVSAAFVMSEAAPGRIATHDAKSRVAAHAHLTQADGDRIATHDESRAHRSEAQRPHVAE